MILIIIPATGSVLLSRIDVIIGGGVCKAKEWLNKHTLWHLIVKQLERKRFPQLSQKLQLELTLALHNAVLQSGMAPSNQVSNELDILSGAAVFNMKRLIGRVDTDPVVHASKSLPFLVHTMNIGIRPFIAALVNNVWRATTPEEVLAIFLVELRTMAEEQLKRPIRNVVLTVPVSFNRFQLTRIERACAMAGLHVLRLMPEPTAVALLYAQQQQQTIHENMGSGNEKVALIFNMGAGYCDVAITATAGGISQIKALSGTTMGGEDMLQNLMNHLVPNSESFFFNHGINDIKSIGLLRVAAQDAIHKLSYQTSVQVEVDLGNGLKISKVVEVEDVSDVILVGGCSHIPMIRNVVKDICKGREIDAGMNSLEAAVTGAALEGAVASADGNNIVHIINRNTTIPARKELVFSTAHDNQSEALIVVYEGEGKKVEENHLLGFFKITRIPPLPKGVPEINVCMDIDASNVLRVLAGVVLPGNKQLVTPFMEVRMPTVDDGHGWCAEAIHRTHGSTLDLVTLWKKVME
ncbi:Heat shock 70 kDa protein 8 [Vitis vinifera]|uniref:Heat shock 70 kDa protein 8 n=1 Tax=Vitis vinifera TaxID=29760 RepID=A0A438F754_VITVI|nr:Heat shock 70 kDa protein 8 [Vitis vinifera]